MSCFPCFPIKKSSSRKEELPTAAATRATNNFTSPPPPVYTTKGTPSNNAKPKPEGVGADDGNEGAKTFTFRELASATKNFRQECLLGEGGFGRVFRGTLQSSGQIVAVRQLDRSGTQGNKEFIVEVLMLSLLRHPNLVSMIGYCADGDQRLLVYEYMPSGSLKNHLFDIPAGKKPLDWSTRMKIAAGIAQGLEYLHEKANPPIIYRDLKSSNILLDEMSNPRLSEYGLTKLVQVGNTMHVSPRVMAAYGYCAPEYERQGELSLKSDVYSFGVVLLELITGRRALDTTRPPDEQNLVSWAQPFFRDPKRFPDMADPLLKNHFPVTSLNQAVGVAAMCLNEEPSVRPLIGDIVAALSFLAIAPPEAPIPPRLAPILSRRVDTMSSQGTFNSYREGDVRREHNSDNEDENKKIHTKKHDKEEEEASDSESDSSSVSSDHEDHDRTPSKEESGKWGSSSKQSSSNRSNSFGSKDYSIGFSLRCDSAYPQRPIPEESDDDSSGDEEEWDNDHGSSSWHRSESLNSNLRREELNGSHSSHSSNEGSEEEDFDPRQSEDKGNSKRSEEGSEDIHSRHSSSEDSESEDEGPKQ